MKKPLDNKTFFTYIVEKIAAKKSTLLGTITLYIYDELQN